MIIAHNFVVNSEGNGRREEGGEGEHVQYCTERTAQYKRLMQSCKARKHVCNGSTDSLYQRVIMILWVHF